LGGAFWGFGVQEGSGGGKAPNASEAFSAKYGAYPTISKLVVVRLGRGVALGSLAEGVSGLFNEYLKDVRVQGGLLEGRNEAGRWFLFKRAGLVATIALGDPDRGAAQARIDQALTRAFGRSGS
jgi:hypothetical protein